MPDPVPSVLQGEPDLREMFHRLNNQLGVILAHAELLESKASESADRARAAQVVASTLEAMATARDLRRFTEVAGV
jgi:two-component sensor histidine kinase